MPLPQPTGPPGVAERPRLLLRSAPNRVPDQEPLPRVALQTFGRLHSASSPPSCAQLERSSLPDSDETCLGSDAETEIETPLEQLLRRPPHTTRTCRRNEAAEYGTGQTAW